MAGFPTFYVFGYLLLLGPTAATLAAQELVIGSAQQRGGCHAPSQESENGLGWLKELVKSTRSSTVVMRNNLRITATSASQVTAVTDNAICTAVAQARAVDMQVPYDNEPVYVYRVGNLYAVEEHVGDAFQGQTSWRGVHFFDLSYNFVSLAGR